MDLSPVQKKILSYYETRICEYGEVPTLRKAAQDNHVSHAAIAQTLRSLENKGYLKREGRYGRKIHLLKKIEENSFNPSARKVPIVGSIAAGLPLYAQQEWAGHLLIDPEMFKGTHLFALKIKGDSMKDAGMLDGDCVICEPRQYAQNGDIVVALIRHEEATVKRFYLRKNGIELRPENPAYSPITYDFGDVLVQGKVIGLVRSL